MEAIQNTPGRQPSLRDHLAEQLQFLDLSARRREVCEGVINNLDRDGRLAYSVEEIAESLDHPASAQEVSAALEAVQRLDPAGVGARDLVECLLLQLDPAEPDYALEREIVLHHLKDIEANRFPKIAKETDRDIEDVKRAIAAVCMLHPAPGRLYDNEVVPIVAPDVFVEFVDDHYEIRLDDTTLPRLRISQQYRELLSGKGLEAEARQFLQKKMESARWLIDSIQQRRKTLLKVSHDIVRAQQEFLEKGLSHLRPLKMQEVADTVGIHVATVSRAIRHKYMQTPRGLLPMKFFFTGGTQSAEGEMQTWDAVKERIKRLVEEEDKVNPLSDDDIVKKLGDGGVHIAQADGDEVPQGAQHCHLAPAQELLNRVRECQERSMAVTIPLGKMKISDKLRALEEIRADLQRTPGAVPSPSWHADVLRARMSRIRARKSSFRERPDAKRSIRECAG